MARSLKTFTTSAGFFDLAVAAPSMKAALEAWGSKRNLFHDGFATVSEDPAIVATTMAQPGLVLRRPVGTSVPFSKDAELPRSLPVGKGARAAGKRRPKAGKAAATKPVDEKTAGEAALAFERQQKLRGRQARKEEAAREKEYERCDHTVAAAKSTLEKAERVHRAKMDHLEKARSAIERKLEAEDKRWKEQSGQLERELREARSPNYLRVVKR
jgi:hypothetical protein